MEKLERSFEIMKASWEILKKDKEILFFPILSGMMLIMLIASFVIPFILVRDPDAIQRFFHDDSGFNYIMAFIFYFCNYLIMIYFNAGIVACATIRMNGGDPTVSDGFYAANNRIFKIIGWAIVSATVGMLLRMIEERSSFIGRAVAGLIGMAWSVTSYLVIPVLVNENLGPYDAVAESVNLLKKTWGEGLIGTFSFGLIFFVLSLPACLAFGMGFWEGKGMLAVALFVTAVVYLIVLSIFQSALQGIFQSALYQYARFGRVPDGFQKDQLKFAVQRKE